MFFNKKEKISKKLQEPKPVEYKREITSIILGSIFIFFLISIISYSPKDNCVFYFVQPSDAPELQAA